MRVLHVPFSYFPSPHGGTEVYVAALANALQTHGVTSVVAAPGERNEAYEWAGLAVNRFQTSSDTELENLYGEGDAAAAAEFGRILDRVRPDLVHFHALTAGASVLAMREAKARHIPLIFTYHTPTASCVRGTMMKWGQVPCEGTMNSQLCTACTLHGKGVPKLISLALAGLPPSALNRMGKKLAKGRMATAMKLPTLVRSRHRATHTAFEQADQIVAVCHWVRDVLTVNGVSAGKIVVSRQGLPGSISALNTAGSGASSPRKAYSPTHPLRMAFFGRLDQTKGVHVVVEALRMQTGLPVVLDIFGIAQGNSGMQYREHLVRLATGDARVKFHDPLESAAVVERMRQYDLVVIPSLWLETGPLIVYEAQAAGVPVLGSRLGGIAELVEDGKTGRLLPAGNVQAWFVELSLLVDRPGVIAEWRSRSPRVRTMADCAVEMLDQYRNCLKNR